VRHDDTIEHLLATDHVILRREHPAMDDALTRACDGGRLTRLLPGVYADPARAADPVVKMAAVTRWDLDAVIRGRGAANLTYWPSLDVGPTLQVASPGRHRPQPGFEFTRWRVPADLVQHCGPIPVTTPSLTAIELATLDDSEAIDRALQTKRATLETLTAALRLTPHRNGNAHRWQVMLDSRAEPWSRAERLAHRLYRLDGISGWSTNHKVLLPVVGTCYLDIAFRRERVAVEVDGWRFHGTPEVFETDRARQNALVLDGWLVLRFTWAMLTQDPGYVLGTTRAALHSRLGC
jgi:very-short-patch-repair endonuclease